MIQTFAASTGASSIGPPFSGQFNNWFIDGSRFQTVAGTSVYTYLNTSLQQDLTSLASVQNLGGQGNWFWFYDPVGTQVNVYKVGSSAAPAATYAAGYSPTLTASGATLGILPSGPAQVTIVDLSGPTLTSSVHALPVSFESAYAATSPSQWLIGNSYGVVFDGTSSAAAPKYLALGAARSLGGGIAAVATASGQVFVINPQTGTVQNTIAFSSNKVELSTDGTVLAAITDLDVTYAYSPMLSIYSLPSGALIRSWGGSGPNYPVDYSLAGSGTVIAQVTAPLQGIANLQQVMDITTSTVVWSSTTYLSPVLFSSDGTRFAATTAALNPAAASNIYLNGTLTGAISGTPVAWIDNGRLLVDTLVGTGTSNGWKYTGATIYGPTGIALSTQNLPSFVTNAEVTFVQTVTSDTIYSNEYNTIYSLTAGAATWPGTPPACCNEYLGAIAGGYAVIISGSQMRAEPY